MSAAKELFPAPESIISGQGWFLTLRKYLTPSADGI